MSTPLRRFTGARVASMATSLDHIYHYYVANVSDRQSRLSQKIGDADWTFDMASGTLSFGSLQLSVQLLGTEAFGNGSWLWAWANTQSGIPEHLTTHSRAMRDYGIKHGITEFSESQLSLDDVDGHRLSVAGAGLMDANAYYRGPYEGGALYMLITDSQITQSRSDPMSRLSMRFAEAVSNFSIPRHKDALLGYAKTLGLATTQQDDSTVLITGDSGECTATFDDSGRIIGIDTQLN